MNIYNLNLVTLLMSFLTVASVKGIVISNNVEFCSQTTTLIGPQLILTVCKNHDLHKLDRGKEIQLEGEANIIERVISLTTDETDQTAFQAKVASNTIKLIILNKPVFSVLPAEVSTIDKSKEYFYTLDNSLTKVASLGLDLFENIDIAKAKILKQLKQYLTKDLYKFLYFKFSDEEKPMSGKGMLKQRGDSYILSGILCVGPIEYNRNFNEIHYINGDPAKGMNDAISYVPVVCSLEKIKRSIGMVYELTKQDVEKIHYLNLKIALQKF